MADCPAASVLFAFALGEKRPAAVEEHLEDCEDCAGFVADLGGDPEDLAPPDEREGLDLDALRVEDGECPTAAALVAYLEGRLSPTAERRVIDHLAAGCETCAEIVLGVSLGGGGDAER